MNRRRCYSCPLLWADKAIVVGLFLLLYVGRRHSAAAPLAGSRSTPAFVVTTRATARPSCGAPFQRQQRLATRKATLTATTPPHRGPAASALLATSSRNPLGARSDGSSFSSRDNEIGEPSDVGGSDDGADGEEDEGRKLDPGQQGPPGPPPVYDRIALARRVFSHPCFYDYKPGAAKLYREEREATFGEDTTVEQVFVQYMVPPGDVSQLVRKIKATDLALKDYFAPAAASIEELLAKSEIVGLSSGDELRKVRRRYVKGLPAVDGVRRSLSHPDDSRNRRLCYIFGPSGSGKTFFAMKEMRTFGNSDADNLPAVTLYFTPEAVAQNRGDVLVDDDDEDKTVPIDFRRDDAPDRLVEKVISLLDIVIRGWGRSWDRRKLQMHVSLVFDEAGASALNGFFDKRVQVDRVLKLAQESIAASVMVVVAGTGLVEFAYDSRREVYVFRMERWKKDDMEYILAARDGVKNKLRLGESVRTVVNAVFFQPALAALATNARSAGFLANSIEKTARLARYSWVDHLCMVAPEVISRVVSQYEEENGIASLSASSFSSQRRRVAAWVFSVLATLEKGSTLLPHFDGLEVGERAVATSLLQYNVVASGGELKLTENSQFSASVTPAIAIILYSMCGIPANVLIGWKSLEESATLYAARHLIVDEGKKHISNIRSLQQLYLMNRSQMSLREFESELERKGQKDAYDGERRKIEAAFGDALEKIYLVRLKSRVQRPANRTTLVSIPMVTSTTVLLNGEKSAFADVIAPYRLIQTKSTLQSRIYVNITPELEKCCLLKDCQDDRVLRALLMVWDGCFSNSDMGEYFKDDYFKDEPDWGSANEALQQESVAYPENLIEVRPSTDPVPGYVTIDSESNVKAADEQSQLRLPSLPPRRSIEFVLFTNAESIQLKFACESQGLKDGESIQSKVLDVPQESKKEFSVLVDRTVLGDDLQLRREKIGESNPWYTFLKDRVMPGVSIRFVFTNPRDG